MNVKSLQNTEFCPLHFWQQFWTADAKLDLTKQLSCCFLRNYVNTKRVIFKKSIRHFEKLMVNFLSKHRISSKKLITLSNSQKFGVFDGFSVYNFEQIQLRKVRRNRSNPVSLQSDSCGPFWNYCSFRLEKLFKIHNVKICTNIALSCGKF
jgi:hypothetical protein